MGVPLFHMEDLDSIHVCPHDMSGLDPTKMFRDVWNGMLFSLAKLFSLCIIVVVFFFFSFIFAGTFLSFWCQELRREFLFCFFLSSFLFFSEKCV